MPAPLSPTSVLFAWSAGGPILNGTFSGSTNGTYVNRKGLLQTIGSSDKIRTEWVDLNGDGVREKETGLLEGSRTNLLLHSEALNDSTAWTLNLVTVSANQILAPTATSEAGSTGADLILETTANGEHHVNNSTLATISANSPVSASARIKARERTKCAIYIQSSAGGDQVRGLFDLVSATAETSQAGNSSARFAAIEALADGWFDISISGVVNTTSTAAFAVFKLRDGAGSVSYVGSSTSGMYLWGCQFEDAPFASSYIASSSQGATRGVESFNFSYPADVRDLSVYGKLSRPQWADTTGTIAGSGRPIIRLSTSAPQLAVFFTATVGNINSFLQSSTGNVQASRSIPSSSPIEFLAQFSGLSSTGETRIDVGSGFSSMASLGGAFSTFGGSSIELASSGDGTFDEPFFNIMSIKVVDGLITRAEGAAIPTAVGRG